MEVFNLPGNFIFKILINVLSELFGSVFFKRTNGVIFGPCFVFCFFLCVLNSELSTKARTSLLLIVMNRL